MTQLAEVLAKADEHLARACPHMARLVREHGPCALQLHPEPFQMLVRSISAQQISGAAARSIIRRLEGTIKPARITPAAVADCGEESLRRAGYSARKASYLLGLAREVLDGSLDFDSLATRPDDEIVERLTKLRGIGVWTAQMYLIFCLGRPDVLPYDDLGVRQALKNFHGLEELPRKREAIELAVPWRPYASVASWYCWRSIDVKVAQEAV
ncbi:MAG: DNA-3-methyladenine glycosylase [Bryobacterales bacterium]|nr:DNA-3-methyladenine glycosylase [Bryobacterales bacterium]